MATPTAAQLMEVDIPGRGRGVVVSSAGKGNPVRAGETVLEEDPLLVYVAAPAVGAVCGNCMRLLPEGCGVACAACGEVLLEHVPHCCRREWWYSLFYCMQEPVRGLDWTDSNRGMKALSGLVSDLTPEHLDLARFLIQAYSLKIDEAANPPAHSRYAGIMALTPPSALPGCEEEKTAQVLHPLICVALGNEPGVVTETAALLRKDAENSYGLMAPYVSEGERMLRGNAMYARASRINHSCTPNVARFDYIDQPGPNNLRVYLRAMDNIPAGAELVQSYFPISTLYEERSERLQSIYGFVCDCARCQHEKSSKEARRAKELEGGAAAEDMSEEAEAMSDDDSEESGESEWETDEEGQADDYDGQLAVYMLKHLCPKEDCNGVLAPPTPVADFMECNFCGAPRTDGEFFNLLQSLQ